MLTRQSHLAHVADGIKVVFVGDFREEAEVLVLVHNEVVFGGAGEEGRKEGKMVIDGEGRKD